MEYQGIVMIVVRGTSGAGKSTIAGKFCEKFKGFRIVQAVTTRERRDDDQVSMYEHVSKKDFVTLDKGGELLVRTKYRGEDYGITHQALKSVLDDGKVPILVLTPESAKTLHERGGEGEALNFFTIFVDAPDRVLDDRLKHRGEQIDDSTQKQRAADREYAENCLYSISNSNDVSVEDTTELVYSLWKHRFEGALLHGKMIKSMIRCGMLLKEADIDKVSGASYDLSLGDQYWLDGKKKKLNNDDPFVKLKPGDYAIVSSKEIADFPRDIAGKFDLTVSLFCKGVILSNGPQVDPGFSGRLFCLLFNTSNATITLKRGKHYATLEFIKLLEPTTPYSGKYQGKGDIIDYLPIPSEPSVISKIREDVDSLKSARWWEKTLPIILSMLAIIASIIMAVILFFIKKPQSQ